MRGSAGTLCCGALVLPGEPISAASFAAAVDQICAAKRGLRACDLQRIGSKATQTPRKVSESQSSVKTRIPMRADAGEFSGNGLSHTEAWQALPSRTGLWNRKRGTRDDSLGSRGEG